MGLFPAPGELNQVAAEHGVGTQLPRTILASSHHILLQFLRPQLKYLLAGTSSVASAWIVEQLQTAPPWRPDHLQALAPRYKDGANQTTITSQRAGQQGIAVIPPLRSTSSTGPEYSDHDPLIGFLCFLLRGGSTVASNLHG